MPPPGLAPGVVDARVLGRPRSYSCTTWECRSAYCVFKAFIGAFSAERLRLMDVAELRTAPIPMSGVTAQEQQVSIQFLYILAQTTAGSSLLLVVKVEASNGMESWRLFVQREGPRLVRHKCNS